MFPLSFALWCRCREAGIEEFIVKPFRVEDLRRAINVCNHVVTSRGADMASDRIMRATMPIPAATCTAG